MVSDYDCVLIPKAMYFFPFQVPGNDMLYYGDSSYKQELVSLSKLVLENLLSVVKQEATQVSSFWFN